MLSVSIQKVKVKFYLPLFSPNKIYLNVSFDILFVCLVGHKRKVTFRQIMHFYVVLKSVKAPKIL